MQDLDHVLPTASLLIGLLFSFSQAQAQVRGLSYTVSPVGEQIFFGDNAGLERGFVYGGEVGLGFGRMVELEAHYLTNRGFATDFSRLDGIQDETRERLMDLPPREVDMRRYGGQLRWNLPTENVVPFILLDAGIIRFEPEHLNATRTIYLGGGAGLQFSVSGRYALTFSARRFGYRYNVGSTFFDDLDLADVGLAPGSFNPTQVYNWALRGGLKVYVGGRAPGEETALDRALREQLSGGIRGLSLRIEPFAATLAFDDRLDFRGDQRFGGVYVGINLGPYVGVRGFYWRGVEGGIVDFESLQAYGGEMRFEMASGQSLEPYITVGGGYMDVLDGYVGRGGAEPGDEPFVLAGLGVVLPVNESLSLSVGARSVMMGEEGVDNVDDPGEVRASWMYTGGLDFTFGGVRPSAAEVIADEARGDTAADAALRAELRRSEARLDSLAREIQRIRAGEPAAPDEQPVARDDQPAADTAGAQRAPAPDRRDPRMVTIPLPEEGELYVRFGRPGGVSIETVTGDGEPVEDLSSVSPALTPEQIEQIVGPALTPEQIEQIVGQTVREQLRASQDAAVTAEQIARIEETLRSELDALESRLQSRLDTQADRLARRQQEPATVVVDRTRVDDGAAALSTGPEALRLFTGMMMGDPNMGVLGMRLDMDTPFLGPIDLQPEFSLGLGAETHAYHVGLDAVYSIPYVEWTLRGLRPYLGLGAGMLGFNEKPDNAPGVQITFNSRLGSDFLLPWGSFFAEFETFDLFEYSRIAAGYRIRL